MQKEAPLIVFVDTTCILRMISKWLLVWIFHQSNARLCYMSRSGSNFILVVFWPVASSGDVTWLRLQEKKGGLVCVWHGACKEFALKKILLFAPLILDTGDLVIFHCIEKKKISSSSFLCGYFSLFCGKRNILACGERLIPHSGQWAGRETLDLEAPATASCVFLPCFHLIFPTHRPSCSLPGATHKTNE